MRLDFLLVCTDIGGTALHIAAQAAEVAGVKLKIDEAIADYGATIADLNAQIADVQGEATRRVGETQVEATRQVGETQAEAARRIAGTTVEGVATLQQLGGQGAYESGVAMRQATMTASAATAKLGASGARATGSPLLAAQQAADLAKEAALNTVWAGNSAVSIGGLKLGGSLQNIQSGSNIAVADISARASISEADITAQSTLLTNEYNRKIAEAQRKEKELQDNEDAMLAIAAAGGAASLYDYLSKK